MKMTMTKDEVLALLQDAIDRDRNSILARVHVGVLAHAKEYLMEQPDVVRCKDCKWYDPRCTLCDNCGLPREPRFFCADGRRKE